MCHPMAVNEHPAHPQLPALGISGMPHTATVVSVFSVILGFIDIFLVHTVTGHCVF